MRAMGPGSVSSFLKIILDVVFAAIWIGIAVLAITLLAAVLLSFNPDLLDAIRLKAQAAPGSELARVLDNRAQLISTWAAGGLYLGGMLVIVGSLRKIFMTLTAGDPFHPDNVARLRLIGLTLAALELGRYAFKAVSAWIMTSAKGVEPSLNLTAWFSVLVVFVLAEVFREGARLRREAELTI